MGVRVRGLEGASKARRCRVFRFVSVSRPQRLSAGMAFFKLPTPALASSKLSRPVHVEPMRFVNCR